MVTGTSEAVACRYQYRQLQLDDSYHNVKSSPVRLPLWFCPR